VLSRPQLLDSDVDVLAQVNADPQDDQVPGKKVTVIKVLWPEGLMEPRGTIEVEGLANGLRVVDKDGKASGEVKGWEGQGRYILPLKVRGSPPSTHFELTRIPASPGYVDPEDKEGNRLPTRPIYRDNPETRSQLKRIRAGKWEK